MKEARILVVDDDLDTLYYLRTLITGWGYSVAVARNGQQGISFLETEPFDLLILDLKMPDIGGLTVLRRVKELKLDPMVIVLSGHLDLYSALEMVKIGGIYECLLKPVEQDKLKASVEKALEHKRLLTRGRAMEDLACEKERLEHLVQSIIALYQQINEPLSFILAKTQFILADKRLSRGVRLEVSQIEAEALKIKEILEKVASEGQEASEALA